MVEIVLGQASSFSKSTHAVSFQFADVQKQGPIEKELLLRLKEMRPWYALINKVTFATLLPFSLFAYSAYMNIVGAFKKLTNKLQAAPAAASPFTDGEAFIVVLFTVIIVIAVGYVLDRFIGYLFPRYFYRIGRQEQDYKRRMFGAQLLLVSIGLAIIVNILSSMLYRPA
jgi:hypothetical protein